MSWKQQCVAVIPCFNEGLTVTGVVVGVKALVAHVLVVDDGSNDATATAARAAGAEVIQHPRNRGKGAALRTGFDSQCGFRLVNLAAWSQVTLQADHFETESELLVQFVRAGFRIEFVPVQVIYHAGGSKIHPLTDTLRWWRWWRQQR